MLYNFLTAASVLLLGNYCTITSERLLCYSLIIVRVAQAVARLATTRMVGGSRPTPDARA